MKMGTKSVLFGVHQFIWHPLTVFIAWWCLYGRPSFKETVCIIIHDWGYIGKPNMDGLEGIRHPEFGAEIANRLFGNRYYYLCLLHSRRYANMYGKKASKLCWADKYSIRFEPNWWYIIRGRLSGEIIEYKNRHDNDKTDSDWLNFVRPLMLARVERNYQQHNGGN